MNRIFFLFLMMAVPFTSVFSQNFTLYPKEQGGQIVTKQLFNGLGVNGKNISPGLYWKAAPPGTKSFALTMYDPTAPTGSGWWHWVIFDIPGNIDEIKEGAGTPSNASLPIGSIQGTNDLGQQGYMGPAPPVGSGVHSYVFTLFALKIEKLGLGPNAGPALVGFYLNSNAIEKASIILYCKR